MQTSVKTTILDNSISGDKIHGGELSGGGVAPGVTVLDLDDKSIAVTGGSVDAVALGWTSACVNPFFSGGIFLNDSVGYGALYIRYNLVTSAKIGQSLGYGYLDLGMPMVGTRIYLDANSSNNSYINVSKLIVGGTTQYHADTKLDVKGNFGVGGIIMADGLNLYAATFIRLSNAAEFADPLNPGSYVNLQTFYTDFIAVETDMNLIDSNVLTSLQSFGTSGNPIDQLSKMGGSLSIPLANWGYLAGLDQPLAKASNPTFGGNQISHVARMAYTRGYIDGFITRSSSVSTKRIDIYAGECVFDLGGQTYDKGVLTAIKTKACINAAETGWENWVDGWSNGGMAVGADAIAEHRTVHIFMLFNPTTQAVNAGFDTDETGINLCNVGTVAYVAGYTKCRRIGSFTIANAAAPFEVRPYYQVGDKFFLASSEMSTLINMTSAYTGIRLIGVPIVSGIILDLYTFLYNTFGTSTDASLTFANNTTSPNYETEYPISGSPKVVEFGFSVKVGINSSGQFAVKQNASASPFNAKFTLQSWTDLRGKDL